MSGTRAALAARAAAGNPVFPGGRIKHTVTQQIVFTDLSAITKLSGAGTGGISLETANPPPGQLSFARINSVGTAGVYGVTLPTTWNLSTGYLRVTGRMLNTATSLRNLTYIFAASKAAYQAGNYVSWVVRPSQATSGNTNWLPSDTWIHDGLPGQIFVTSGTGCDLTAVGYIGFTIQQNSGTATLTYDLGRFELVTNVSAKAKCVIWHDDGHLGGSQAMRALMDPYGFKLTEAFQWGEANGNPTFTFTTAQLQEHAAAGAQIATHANLASEHFADEPANLISQAYRNMLDSRRLGLPGGATDMSWWGGQSIATAYLAVIRAYYRSSRYNTTGLTMPETLPPAEPWAYKANLVTTSDTFTGTWKPMIDNAILCKGMASFVFHQDVQSGTTAFINEFKAMLAWLDQNRANIDVVTAAQAFATST